MTVTVHSLGAVDAPASKVVLRDKAGKTMATRRVPALKAPLDLTPKTAAGHTRRSRRRRSERRKRHRRVRRQCAGDHADEQQRDAVAEN